MGFGFNPLLMWKAPIVNPVNHKARSIPLLNPFNVYGRVFNFSWFGFFIAFWAWYAFPPLLNDIVAKNVGLSKPTIANSNIIALVATLLVRVVSGPLCDRFGPRKTFAGILIVGSIPAFCAGGVENAAGLLAVRFFIGILGGSFVPCQVWTTGFFDKNVVGTANALTAGFGNAGGGVTYFVMPAIYNALVSDGLSVSVSWRVAFVIPAFIIVVVAIAMLICCPDTPTGAWADRNKHVQESLQHHNMVGVVDIPGELTLAQSKSHAEGHVSDASSANSPSPAGGEKKDIIPPTGDVAFADGEAPLTAEQMMETAKGEIIRKPTWREAMAVAGSPQTWVTMACYFCSFGTELSVNSILGTYYVGQFKLSLQESGNWAAMFGLLNVVTRPLGGALGDAAYHAFGGSVWAKKALLHSYALITGAFLLAIGLLNSKDEATMFGLIAGMAFFLEGGNGLNYALVPHVHPYANGIVSGLTGASGNLGGIIFAIIFRFTGSGANQGKDYGKAIWIIGVITIVINLAVCWIRPIPKGQIGGR